MWIVIFLLAAGTAQGYIFECLDKCECDTKDEVIHCHNNPSRTTLFLPSGERLRGFQAIGLTFNNIQDLPSEEDILAKFPDLLAIDVERNPSFACPSILNYVKVKIISDCYKNVTDVNQIPPLLRPSKDCDISCQAQKHYAELHKYVLKLWEIIKEKYKNFDKETLMRKIKEFFIETLQAFNKSLDRTLEEFHPRNQKKVHEEEVNEATPMPTLARLQELQKVELNM